MAKIEMACKIFFLLCLTKVNINRFEFVVPLERSIGICLVVFLLSEKRSGKVQSQFQYRFDF